MSKSSWTCSNCGRTNEYYLLNKSISIACNYCNHIFEYENGEYKNKGKNQTHKSNINIVFDIGTDVFLPETGTCKVLGIVVRQDKKYLSFWLEYYLQSETKGAFYLSCYDGHWHLFKENNELFSLMPNNINQDLTYNFNFYKLFNYYQVRNFCLVGEIVYGFQPKEVRRMEEYISPPYIISFERLKGKQETAFEGKYIPQRKLQKYNILANGFEWPTQKGTGAAEPNLIRFKPTETFLLFTVIAFLLLIANVVFNTYYKKNEVVLNYNFSVDQSNRQKTIKTPNFLLEGHNSNLEIIGKHDVNNHWAYSDITLVKVNSDLERSLELEFSYYTGYEGGEYWSEGENELTANLNNVEAGEYYLLIIPDADASSQDIHNINLKVIWQPANYRNLIWSVVFLIVYWSIGKWYFNYFEYNRWENAYTNPYDND